MSGSLDSARLSRFGSLSVIARSPIPLVIGLGVAFLMEFTLRQALVQHFHQSGEFYAKVILDIGINVILAVSLNIVNGYTGQFSLGHAGFMAVGGYVAGIITYYGSYRLWGSSLPHGVGMFGSGQLLFVAACLVGGLVASFAGYLVGIPSLRLSGDYLAIVTLGFGEIIRVFLQLSHGVLDDADEIRRASWGTLVTSVGGSLGFSGLPYYTNMFWVYFFVVLVMAVAYRLKYSSYGRSFLAIREDEKAAEALGVPVFKYKVRAFVIAAFFAGIAGGLYGHEVGTQLSSTDLSFMKSIEVVILVVLGGMGSVSGCVLAAVILTILPEALRGFDQYRLITYSLMLIIMMIIRPSGICGIHEIWEVPWLRRLWRRREAAS